METRLGKFLNEQAWGKSGDYDFGDLNYVTLPGTLSPYSCKPLVKTLHDGVEVYLTRVDKYYVICLPVPTTHPTKDNPKEIYERGLPIVAMRIVGSNPITWISNKMVFTIRGVEVKNEYKNRGFGKLIYKMLTKDLGFLLLNDTEQYEGARKVWVSLSNDPDFKVTLVDFGTQKVIKDNLKLTDYNDPRVWAFKDEEPNSKVGRLRRLILTYAGN